MDPSMVGRAQGPFYVTTGLWPVVHLRSFEAVTGSEADGWLVRTAGMLVACIGATVWRAAEKGRVTREIALLGASSAVGLAAADLVEAARRRWSPFYLLGAALEVGLAAAWWKAHRAATHLEESARPAGVTTH